MLVADLVEMLEIIPEFQLEISSVQVVALPHARTYMYVGGYVLAGV